MVKKRKKIKRGTINYIADILIGAGFIVSMVSGIVFLFVPSSGGFQGGRNPYFMYTILGMDRWFIKDLHTWSSILLAVGVFGHLILHWNWFVCMTRNFIKKKKPGSINTGVVKVPSTETCREEG